MKFTGRTTQPTIVNCCEIPNGAITSLHDAPVFCPELGHSISFRELLANYVEAVQKWSKALDREEQAEKQRDELLTALEGLESLIRVHVSKAGTPGLMSSDEYLLAYSAIRKAKGL